MTQSASVWFVVLVALLAANLPFLNDRLLAVVLLYFVVGGLGLLLEQRLGRIAPQGWEFYAITGTFFLTLAFPGFVFRYLYKRHG
jgi:hypothetical protein